MIDSLKSLFGTSKGYYKRMQKKTKGSCHSSWGFRIVIFILFNMATMLHASPLPIDDEDGGLSNFRKLQQRIDNTADSIRQEVSLPLSESSPSSAFPFEPVAIDNDDSSSRSSSAIKSLFNINNQNHHQRNANSNNKTNVQFSSSSNQAQLSTDEDGGSNSYLNSFHKVKATGNGHHKPKTVVVSNGGKRKIFRADKSMQRVEKKSWKIPIKSVGLYSENSKDAHAPQKFMDELTQIFDSFKDS